MSTRRRGGLRGAFRKRTIKWSSENGRLNGQSEFYVNHVYPCTDSGPPDNPCPIRFRWRSMTHVHNEWTCRSIGAVTRFAPGRRWNRRPGPEVLAPARSSRGAAIQTHVWSEHWSLTRSDQSTASDSKQHLPR